MKLLRILLLLSISFFLFVLPVFADDTPTPSPSPAQDQNTSPPPSNTLSTFFGGFDWISDGFIFHTPDVFTNPITLQDGTTLSGIGSFMSMFYDIAIPIFAIIVAGVALSHINSDNLYQLLSFGKRLVVVAVLFITAPQLLQYSIQFINLLDQQVMKQATTTIVPMIVSYVNSPDFKSVTQFSWNPFSFFNPNTLLQVLLLVISFGFLLIGFLYIVFQAVVRFMALLVLSVLLPITIPFALSEKTQNITNTFFKVWFTFLIGQPAFILGYALSMTILGSLLQNHGGSVGTLFLFSGSLIFLGSINIFVGKIFGDGWSLIATDLQAGLVNSQIQSVIKRNFGELQRGFVTGEETGVRSSIGAAIGRKMGFLTLAPDSQVKTSNLAEGENITKSSLAKLLEKKTPRKNVAV